ncbi:MAG: PLP-dependent aminotransferase family protein [Pyramidobacter sp.]|nr:PLP-dependent aminotransferase family protein [Pyramidobacter sp.]
MEFKLSKKAVHLRRCMMDAFHLRNATDMIFFNAGQPAVDILPAKLLKSVWDEMLDKEPQVLAYPNARGDAELLEAVAERMDRLGIAPGVTSERVIATNGGTGAADLLAQLFIDPGDLVLTETPTFPETLDCFYKDFARLQGVPMDIDGPLPDALEALVKKETPKFFYVIPNFQNPTGRRTSLERRKAVIDIARKYGFFIVEDDPYHELYFDAVPPASYYSLAPDCTIYMGSLSKTVAPGVRTGWLVLPEEVMDRAVMAQKATVLSYPAVIHRAMARVLRHPDFDAHVEELRLDLKRRYQLLSGLLERSVRPDQLTWEVPLGGMFLWCRLHTGENAMDFATRVRDTYRVAFFPGVCFTPDYTGEESSVRFTFARQTDAQMAEGVRRIAAALNEKA